MREQFNTQINALLTNKARNNVLLTYHQYTLLVNKIKESRLRSRKTPQDYHRIVKYDIVQMGGIERIVTRSKNPGDPTLTYVFLEESFDILHDVHLRIGHGGRCKMLMEIKTQYKNLTAELVKIYLLLCQQCVQRKQQYKLIA